MPDFFQILSQTNFGELSPVIIVGALIMATFVSEDLACITAGALAGQGVISFPLALGACFAGIFFGDLMLYFTGRIFGRKILQIGFFSRLAPESSIEKASKWLDRRSLEAIFLSRFITGLRLPTYLAAGFLRTDSRKFALYFLLASAVWTPILVGASAYSARIFSTHIFIGVILIFVMLRAAFHFSGWKNRRLFLGRIIRWLNWEFWSLRLFYFPVVIYVLLLAVKHRSLTIFTCANPAIPASGFVGESKHEIYEGLRKSPAAEAFLLPYVLISPENPFHENLKKAEDFITQNDLKFPLAFKPDAGERGKGVTIVRNFDELERNLRGLKSNFILQEFFAGDEASVFYYRYPDEKKGRIFSITEKRFPIISGDGNSDLETLILRDKRAVALAKKYFEQNAERLDLVPAAGEEVQIINIGTHSRGAIFADGERFKTEILEEKVDAICRGFRGFYFGRFDLRCRTFDDLKRGENFKIIELNGVTSESTNIYDSKFSLFDAYRILFRQWRIAFEIGAENRRRGARATKISDLAKLVFGKTVELPTMPATGKSEITVER